MKRRHLLLALWPAPLLAHEFRLGDIVIEHPYALPSSAGTRQAAVHFRRLANRGQADDRLLSAAVPSGPPATLRRAVVADGRRQWQAVDAIALPARGALSARHDGEWQILLNGLDKDAIDGDRIAVLLRFERAGEREVVAWVQMPRA